MSIAACARVRDMILDCLGGLLVSGSLPDPVPDGFNLIGEGVIDSLGFVQLLAELESRLGLAIDFAGLDPEEFAVVGPLSRHICRQQAETYEPL